MITQRQRWVPGSPRIRCSHPPSNERDDPLRGVQRFRRFSPEWAVFLALLAPWRFGNFGSRLTLAPYPYCRPCRSAARRAKRRPGSARILPRTPSLRVNVERHRGHWPFQPRYFNLTAEPACLPCWHRQAEDAEDDEIFPLDSGRTGLGTRNSFPRARMREGPTPHGFAFSAISAVKNPGSVPIDQAGEE